MNQRAGQQPVCDVTWQAPLTCQTGAACVYARYLDQPGAAARLESQGVTDVSSFTTFYWSQQMSTAETLFLVTTAAGLGGAVIYGIVRPKPRPTPGVPVAQPRT